MRFAAALSAWWLLLAVPLVVLLAVMLYRRQSRAITPGHAWGLTLLRAIILTVVVVLAFRPSLIRRDIATFPGRMLLVLDDSASMGIHDRALTEDEALIIANKTQDGFAAREAPAASLRDNFLATERMLIRFEQFGRRADRQRDVFWQEANRVKDQVYEQLESMAERASDLANSAGDPATLHDAATRFRDLQTLLEPLFVGDEPQSGEFVLKMRSALNELTDVLSVAQVEADRARIDAGDPVPTAAIETVRNAPRLDLAYAWIKRHRDALIASLEGVSLWVLPLAQQGAIRLSKIEPGVPALSTVETDITGVLLRHIEEENPFPLVGIVLFSDGRNLGRVPLESVTQAAIRRAIPIYTAGVGSPEEPFDIALRGVYYPPVAVVGKPLGIRTQLKTVLSETQSVDIALSMADQEPIVTEKIEIAGTQEMRRRLVFKPEAEGLQRLSLRVDSVEEEVVPLKNNHLDFTVRVRKERVRVLFLDWKPRWESRFVLNILSRLDYLDVNALIGLVQPDGVLKRGVGKGFWPENPELLALYDLVILGELPSDLLTKAEWQALNDYVEAGGSLALLGSGRLDPLPGTVVQNLLPALPRAAKTLPPADAETLHLTAAGCHHPVTRALKDILQSTGFVAAEGWREDTLGLLQTGDGRLLVSTRFVGAGKTLFLDTDRLWRRLNPSALDAHAALVAGIADWAIEARKPADQQPQPDLFRYASHESVQIWTAADSATNPVVEVRDGDRMLEAPAYRAHPGATWAAAVFESLPPGDWIATVRGGGAASEPIRVVDRSRELHDLSRDETWLRALAANAGGQYTAFTDAGRLLNHIQPTSRIERRERIWRLWDSSWVLGGLIAALTIEWIWRKLAGLA